MDGQITASGAVDLIHRLAEALASAGADGTITVRVEDNGNLWVGSRLAATIWQEA